MRYYAIAYTLTYEKHIDAVRKRKIVVVFFLFLCFVCWSRMNGCHSVRRIWERRTLLHVITAPQLTAFFVHHAAKSGNYDIIDVVLRPAQGNVHMKA